MRLLILLTMLLAGNLAYSQGTTTAEYYQYQRDQQFKSYMENVSSKGMASPANTNFNYTLDKNAVNEFFDLIQRRNQGNKVVETEEQKKAIRAQMEMDRIDAEIKANNEAEAARERPMSLS